MDASALPIQSECEFYHSIDLPNVGHIPGAWDLRGRFGDYVAHTPVTGRTFLDVGTATGFLSFEAERHGAIVTSFDADGPERYEHVTGDDSHNPTRFRRLRNGYAFSHSKLGSRAKLTLGDIYSMSESVVPHDVVLVGQILVHLRDPFLALQQAAKATKDTLIITEGSFESDQPLQVFLGAQSYYSWWHLSTGLYKTYLSMLGFDVVSVTKGQFTCLQDMPGQVDLWTFVARRVTECRKS
jgi:hypothetical protein